MIEYRSLCFLNKLCDISLGLSVRQHSGLSYYLVLFESMHSLNKEVRRSATTSHLTITTASSTHDRVISDFYHESSSASYTGWHTEGGQSNSCSGVDLYMRRYIVQTGVTLSLAIRIALHPRGTGAPLVGKEQ